MIEDAVIIQLNVSHYEALLKQADYPPDLRAQVTKLLTEARSQLSQSALQPPDRASATRPPARATPVC